MESRESSQRHTQPERASLASPTSLQSQPRPGGRRPPVKKMTDEQKRFILTRKVADTTTPVLAIAKKLQVPRSTVHSFLNRFKLSESGEEGEDTGTACGFGFNKTLQPREKVAALLMAGLKMEDIVNRLEYPKQFVQDTIDYYKPRDSAQELSGQPQQRDQ